MKTITALSIIFWLAAPITSTGGKEIDWSHNFSLVSEPAHYSPLPQEYPPDLYHDWRTNVIQRITDDSWYGDTHNVDLLKLLPPLKEKTEQGKLKELNNNINHAFKYYSGPMNYWYSEPPLLAMFIGVGDCKAYAYFKYWTLRQMGYTNVKLVTIILPNGRGSLAGHVVVLLNDLWVLDINEPYYYPFEVLRETSGLNEAIFPDSTVWDVQ